MKNFVNEAAAEQAGTLSPAEKQYAVMRLAPVSIETEVRRELRESFAAQRRKADFVRRVYDRGDACDDCQYCTHELEAEPYGDGNAYRNVRVCGILENDEADLDSCAGFE